MTPAEIETALRNLDELSVDCLKAGRITEDALVMRAFDPAGEKRDVNHLNGIKCDNRVCNLEWATRSENMNHAVRAGLALAGERNGQHRLTAAQVVLIRAGVADGKTHKSLAVEYGVARSTITKIANNYRWRAAK